MGDMIGFHLRLTSEEREIVRRMAKRERRSDTAMIRQAIEEAAESRGMPIEGLVGRRLALAEREEGEAA